MSTNSESQPTQKIADAHALIKEIIAANFKSVSHSKSKAYPPTFVTTLGAKRDFQSTVAANQSSIQEHSIGLPSASKQFRSGVNDIVVRVDDVSSSGESLHIVDVGTTNKEKIIINTPVTEIIEEPVSSEPETNMDLPVGPSQNFVITEIKQPENQQIVLTEDELAEMPVKDLNTLLRGLPESEVLKLKQKRRTIKNRGYAQTSRTKRTTQKTVLENEKMTLEEQLECLSNENDMLRRERDEARIKLEAFERFAGMSGIVIMSSENNEGKSTFTSSTVISNNAAVPKIVVSSTGSNKKTIVPKQL